MGEQRDSGEHEPSSKPRPRRYRGKESESGSPHFKWCSAQRKGNENLETP